MSHEQLDKEETIPFFPDQFMREFRVVIGIMGIAVIIGILGMINPVGLEEPADPFNTPAHVKPEWYFLGLYQLLKFVPKTTGVLIPIVGVVLLAIWPFLDRKKETDRKMVKIRGIMVAIGMLILIALTIWGGVS
jgi:quinol-cytochrome oxidoreductase complex cytochrome b subunit